MRLLGCPVARLLGFVALAFSLEARADEALRTAAGEALRKAATFYRAEAAAHPAKGPKPWRRARPK